MASSIYSEVTKEDNKHFLIQTGSNNQNEYLYSKIFKVNEKLFGKKSDCYIKASEVLKTKL